MKASREVAAEPTARRVIDLRSDTITQPTEAMREAMARAEVGDDVLGEDPTVRRLEATAAERTGKAAALFVASGTMANLAAVMAHTSRGDEVILDDQAHTYLMEGGGAAALAGVMPRPLPTERGIIRGAQLEAALRPPDVHHAPARLVCVENTHNRHGGTVATVEAMEELAEAAHRHGLRVHLDGARLFNAAVALGVPAARLAAPADSVAFCLSKGLSAPVGSLLCGDAMFIARARHVRKMLGGGMRQAGVIAAAGLVALDTMVERLADDHHVARRLAEALANLPGVRIDLSRVQTNIVRVELPGHDARAVAERLRARGVRVSLVGPRAIRLVANRHVTQDDVPEVVEAFRAVL
ncbi:MAG: low-specificity L-threonine aldolase [Armatimonadota bacterium]|nr:low-specificity L-threonine aldolase [Armatimonadota bacterium]MDR7421340.1 low-specificity L-threonine aldolase [Armatimonadota bacterium]MDR7455230.1 low-specificity L-threonine aldolase [Armatimonadota bacterium]MDR7456510.1 low-specificity L-threonine aldolase [Armatimonadota bacterium]MDR7496223.1 low-specificity L-threonine aldolase [Armatimonadota bacterium]